MDYYHMSEFGPGEIESRINFVVYDYSAADSSAQRDHHGVFRAFRGSCDRFGESCGVGVVFDVYCFHSEIFLEDVRNREIDEVEVVGVFNDAFFAVGGTGSCDAGIFDLIDSQSLCVKKFLAEIRHVANDRAAFTFCSGRNAVLDQDVLVFVDDSDSYIRSAEIDSEIIHCALRSAASSGGKKIKNLMDQLCVQIGAARLIRFGSRRI